MNRISQTLIDRYSAGPSKARTTEVKKLHEAVRARLPSGIYETFLQGSYRNGTAISDINDVDIVALRIKDRAPQEPGSWIYDFNRLEELLSDKWVVSQGDKCVRLFGATDVDVVPAIRGVSDWKSDPVVVYSRRGRQEIPNHPRWHITNGQLKQAGNSSYKATVRLLKRWARQYKGKFNLPSFYLESAVFNVSDSKFSSSLPVSFLAVGVEMCGWDYSSKYVGTVAGDKDILQAGEWSRSDFETFRRVLLSDLGWVSQALEATTTAEANRKWKIAFGD